MVDKDIVQKLKKDHPDLKSSQISSIIEIVFKAINESLILSESVELREFGRWSVKITKEKYNARNPKNAEIIYVPKKKKVSFKMSKHLKEEVNKTI
ncbi:HU family DNA-binding protein [Pelagibacteraceae bacterium]|nr:HU family DNA-binding protein [Pelagibacteraceae bacterium]